ncbi:protein canopy homolog 2 isoform X2 [Triplophysa dalaica]|uniref:protein canopy homolog 2 isoform X2 n=1 Tax=Triplophysa dalaica TaxID=1582913 RepID=UPI0024DF823E|nr:protein canopy homolog 2 isoform X2 [Triplophysa dalaica]
MHAFDCGDGQHFADCSSLCIDGFAPIVNSRLQTKPQMRWALVDEMEWAISQIDPKIMIQTGSFRINPDGSQSVKETPFARSESHLLELMEEVCEQMKDYGEGVDPTTNGKTYVRHTPRDGKAMDLSDVAFDSSVSSRLKFACESIVEQHEDELIEFFAHETHNVKDKLCSERTDLCDHALQIANDEL